MIRRPAKLLLLILLLPALLYGALKLFMYLNARHTVEEIVEAAAGQAEIRYAGISTDVRGAVTVSGIEVQALGYPDSLSIDALRVASDDPLFFILGGSWRPGQGEPPQSLSLSLSGIRLPLSDAILRTLPQKSPATGGQLCARGLQIEPQMLKAIGFSELHMDMDFSYRLDRAQQSMQVDTHFDLHNVQSMQMSATLTDIDLDALAMGSAPQLNLGRMETALRISPEFGRQLLKACAIGTALTTEQWSGRLADGAIAQFAQQGVTLGEGLRKATHDFYTDWGEFRIVAAPPRPVGLMSLIFLPPEQLADALSLRLSINDRLVTDTSFVWQRPGGSSGLPALFGAASPVDSAPAAAPRRIIVRREFETVSVADIARYVDHQVQVQPAGQPLREGVLKAISDGTVEIEQALHGGRFSVYVPLAQIESVQALVRHELPAGE